MCSNVNTVLAEYCMVIHLFLTFLDLSVCSLSPFAQLINSFSSLKTLLGWPLVADYGYYSLLSSQHSVHFSSVAQSCKTLCDPMNRSTPGLPVHHQLPEFTQTHAHWVGDVIQPFHPLSFPSPPAPNPSQHHGLFQWVSSLHQVAKVLELQLQHQSF